MRTISGITPVAVMLPPRECEHGNCVYCPKLNVPQSYTPKSPVVMRAMRVKYDAYKQVKERLKVFEAMGHPTEKVELIIMGGTFLEYPKKFQYEFVKNCYDALNILSGHENFLRGKKNSKNLEDAKKLNESKSEIFIRPSIEELKEQLKIAQLKNERSKQRCVALCIETRPDVCSKFIDRMREWGVTRVELGVQIIDDEIYRKVKRGHTVQDVVDATKNLKDTGFKVGYHIMPGLPGSNLKKDLELFKKLFSDERFKPDQLKLYPCQVMPGSELENLYWDKKFVPYTKEETEKILIEMMKAVPRYCRVMRVMREIPPEYIVAGTIKIDLRKIIEEEMRKNNVELKEIRYREVGFNSTEDLELKSHHGRIPKGHENPKEGRVPLRGLLKQVPKDFLRKSLLRAKITKYKASGGDEHFLEIVNSDDVLFGLLRLRIKNKNAIVRELHVYGQALNLGKKGINVLQGAQHSGLGKWLMEEAEKICLREKIKKLKVISGIGVREYYEKLGYELEGEEMVREI